MVFTCVKLPLIAESRLKEVYLDVKNMVSRYTWILLVYGDPTHDPGKKNSTGDHLPTN